MSWLGRLFSRARQERDLDKELSFHVETRMQDHLNEGVAPAEARRRALAEFGGIEPIKEHARDARGTRWVGDLIQDVHYALRMLRANPGFTLAAVLSLAVGIGANAAVFRVIDGLVLRTVDVRRPEELFFVETTDAKSSRMSHPVYQQLAAAVPGATFAVMTSPSNTQVTVDGAAELRNLQLVSGNWFSFLGVEAQAGRLLTPADDSVSTPHSVVVISDRYWTRQFARSPAAIGATILLNNAACEIVGVAPASFSGLMVGTLADVWVPVTMQPALRYRGNASNENADDSQPWVPQDGIAWLTVIGRAPRSMNRGVLLASLEGRYHQALVARTAEFKNESRRARFLRDRIVVTDASRGLSPLRTQLSPALTVLMSMVGLVLLVACANLANLLLARGAARGREFALRLSIGARRGRLIRQLLTESVTLAALGGAAAMVVAWWGGGALLRLVSSTATPVPVALPVDWRVLAFGGGATLTTGLLFGLVPALRLSRPDMHDSLKTGGRVINSGRRGRVPLVKVLVAVQVAVSLLLLTGAALFFRTFQNLVRIEAGYDRESVVDARFDTRLSGVAEKDLPAFYARLLDEARRVPGVKSATIGLNGPVSGSVRTSGMVVDGYTPPPGEDLVAQEDYVGPEFFTTLGMRMLDGRDFAESDDLHARKVAVINETMAKKYFGARSPIGRGFGYNSTQEFEVIGVVADARANGLRKDVPALAIYPLKQNPEEFARNLYVRAAGAVDPVVNGLKQALKAAAPGLALREVVTLGELTERTVSSERLVSRLAAVFGVLGLAVACLGLYGTIAYSVARRTTEIGVRLALGASPSGVRAMVLRETLGLVWLGVAGGMALVLALGRLAETQLYGLSSHDPSTLAITCLTIVTVGVLAGVLPAWRAARVSPMVAIRSDN